MPAPRHSVFYRPDALPAANQQRQSTEGKHYCLISRAFQFGQKKFRFDSRYRIDFFDSIRFANLIHLPLVQIVMMVSLVKGLAASLYAVVHSVPYQYQLDNFQQVKNVCEVLNAANNDSAYFLAETVQ